jgi:PRTRC genetic system protein E
MISFKLLEKYLENADLNLVLKKTANGIVISILPKPNVKDKAKENLIPLIIRGTSDELDQKFIQLINTQLEQTNGIISNIAEFEAQAEEMKNKSDANKKIKEAKIKADEKSKKELDGADKLLAESKFDECQEKIDKSLKNNEKYKPALNLQEKLNKLKPQNNQVDIFGIIEEEEKIIKDSSEKIKEQILKDEKAVAEVCDKVIVNNNEEIKPIAPNNNFDNEIKMSTNNNEFEPYNPEIEMWENKGFDRGNNNESINFI